MLLICDEVQTGLARIEINWGKLDMYDHDNFQVIYQQLEEDLEEFGGEWLLSQVDDSVYVTLKVNFESGILMLATLMNPLLKEKFIIILWKCY